MYSRFVDNVNLAAVTSARAKERTAASQNVKRLPEIKLASGRRSCRKNLSC